MRRFASIIILALFAVTVGTSSAAEPTALDRYIKKVDATYSWKHEKTVEGNPTKTFVIDLKSQTWRSKEDVDRPVWQHWLVIVKPEKVTASKAFLLIGGGSNGGAMPSKADPMVMKIAEETNSIVAELRMVPNQPLVFHNDGKPRKEDDLIGYCWNQFLKTGDETWLPRLPMVKSAVRAMDCVQEFMASEPGGKLKIEKFVVAGGSKRGWTTWMTAAADARVEAIIPIVIDVLNVNKSMLHHAGAYGFWAKAVGDYVRHGIMSSWDNPRLKELYAIEDPYHYRDRLTMPKFVLNAGGDQFFLPDSSQFYYDDLKGEKLLRYVPNADHSLRGSDALESIVAYYSQILNNKPRPKVAWTFEKDGPIRVKCEDAPTKVLLWQATNPKARDFRLVTIGPAYKSTELKREADGTYFGKVETPKEGFTAYFVETTHETGGKYPLKLTTAVRVLPDRLPHGELEPKKVPYEASAPSRP